MMPRSRQVSVAFALSLITQTNIAGLPAALGQTGRIEEAKEVLARAIAMTPAAFDMFVRRRVLWHRPEDHAHMLEGLRKAGWREE